MMGKFFPCINRFGGFLNVASFRNSSIKQINPWFRMLHLKTEYSFDKIECKTIHLNSDFENNGTFASSWSNDSNSNSRNGRVVDLAQSLLYQKYIPVNDIAQTFKLIATTGGHCCSTSSVASFINNLNILMKENKSAQLRLFNLIGYDHIEKYLTNYVAAIPKSLPEYKSDCLALVTHLMPVDPNVVEVTNIQRIFKRLTLSVVIGLLDKHPSNVSNNVLYNISKDIHSVVCSSTYKSEGNEDDIIKLQLHMMRIHWMDVRIVDLTVETIHHLLINLTTHSKDNNGEDNFQLNKCRSILTEGKVITTLIDCIYLHCNDKSTLLSLLDCAKLYLDNNSNSVDSVNNSGFVYCLTFIYDTYKNDAPIVSYVMQLVTIILQNDNSSYTYQKLQHFGMQNKVLEAYQTNSSVFIGSNIRTCIIEAMSELGKWNQEYKRQYEKVIDCHLYKEYCKM